VRSSQPHAPRLLQLRIESRADRTVIGPVGARSRQSPSAQHQDRHLRMAASSRSPATTVAAAEEASGSIEGLNPPDQVKRAFSGTVTRVNSRIAPFGEILPARKG